jgi:hypothetical protein
MEGRQPAPFAAEIKMDIDSPLKNDAAKNAGRSRAQNILNGPAMRRILVVDDDPQICQAISIWLRQL